MSERCTHASTDTPELRHGVQPALDRAAAQSHLAFATILDRAGAVIAHSRAMTATDLSLALHSAAFAQVRAGVPVSLSDVLFGGDAEGEVVDLVVPVHTAEAQRILVAGLPAARI